MSIRIPSSFHGGSAESPAVRKRSRRNRIPVPVVALSVRCPVGSVDVARAEPISTPPLNEK
jgi:hypothetical protein